MSAHLACISMRLFLTVEKLDVKMANARHKRVTSIGLTVEKTTVEIGYARLYSAVILFVM